MSLEKLDEPQSWEQQQDNIEDDDIGFEDIEEKEQVLKVRKNKAILKVQQGGKVAPAVYEVTGKEQQDAIALVNRFITASSSLDPDLSIYENLKEFSKQTKYRYLLISNDLHLHLRDGYRCGLQREQAVLEIIYQISLEPNYCEQVGIQGEMVDEAFVFLQTHMKYYYDYQTQHEKSQQTATTTPVDLSPQIEIIDSSTLLKLDLWVRILSNFLRNQTVLKYVVNNKTDVLNYLLLFLQNIDDTIKQNPNISSINSILIASTIKMGVLDILFQLTQVDEMKEKVISSEVYFKALYQTLLRTTSNQAVFSSVCKLVSQLAISHRFPTNIFGDDLIKDYVLSYMMRCVYNLGIDDGTTPQQFWMQIQSDREKRNNLIAELGLARTFCFISFNGVQRKKLVKVLEEYEDNILVRFILKCFEQQLVDAQIYMILGLIHLVEHEHILISKDYQKRILLYVTDKSQRDFSSAGDQKQMCLSILLRRLIRLIPWSSQEILEVMEVIGNKLDTPYTTNTQIPKPTLNDKEICKSMQSKRKKKFEEKEQLYYQDTHGYQVEGLIINDKEYGHSVDYSQLLSEMSEADFVDSLLEDDIFHLRNNEVKIDQDKQFTEQLGKNNNNKSNGKHQVNKHSTINNKKNQNGQNKSQAETCFPFEKTFAKSSRQLSSKNSIQPKSQDNNPQSDRNVDKNVNKNQQKNNNVLQLQQQQQQAISSNKQNNIDSRSIGLAPLSIPNSVPGSFGNATIIKKDQNENTGVSSELGAFKLMNNKPSGDPSIPVLQYLSNHQECFLFSKHSRAKCESCSTISRTFFFDQSAMQLSEWLFDAQTGRFDEQFQQNTDYFFENTMSTIHCLFYLSMISKGELPIPVLKMLCHVLSRIDHHPYSDRRYSHAIILLFQHCLAMNPSLADKLINFHFLGYQDYLLTQLLNSFGYKTFSLLALVKKGALKDDNPIFQQVLRKNSRLLSSNPSDNVPSADEKNIYERLVIQSTLLLEFDGYYFQTSELVLSAQESAQFIKAHFDAPVTKVEHLKKLTDYCLQLHAIQHSLGFTYKMLKKTLQNKNSLIAENAAKFLDQFVYLLLFFNDLNNFIEPNLPFYPKTICWTQNKTLITSCLQKIVAILKLLILRKTVLLEYYKIQKYSPHLLEVIMMAQMFPSFKGSSMLFSVVYAVYAHKQSIKEEFNSYDLHCFCEGMASASIIQKEFEKKNESIFKSSTKVFRQFISASPVTNIKPIKMFLRFETICLSFLSSFESKSILKTINSSGIQQLSNFLQTQESCLELCKKLQLLKESLELLKTDNKNNVNNDNINNNYNLTVRTNNIGQIDEELFEMENDYQSSFLLFLSSLASFRHFAETILSHTTFQYLVNNMQYLQLTHEAQFCFTSSLHSLSKTMVTLDNIQRQYPNYSKDISKLIYSTKFTRNNLMPLFRSVRILLQHRREDSQYFREMIPKLREFSEISQVQPLKCKNEFNLQLLNFILKANHNRFDNYLVVFFCWLEFRNKMGELELSAITSRDGLLLGIGSGKGSSAANQSFLNSNSLLDIVKMDNKSNKNMFNSFLEEDEMTFLQNMKDERESAVLTINESILQLDNEKNMDINQKRNYFKDLFLRESRLLLKLLVLVSENELQQQIKEMKLNKDLKITEAGTLSKKTQKQYIDIEEKKKKIIERPLVHDESEMYGLNIKQEYQSPLSWVPDFYKLSSVELYEARMKAKAKEQAKNNETIPIIIPKDDSDSTMIRIQNDLVPDILDRQPDFLKKQNVQFAQNDKNKNTIKPNDFFEENNKKVESLQQFMKQQQQMKLQQLEQQNNPSGDSSNINASSNPKKVIKESAKNLLPMLYDAGSISSIHIDQLGSSKSKNNSMNFAHNPSAPSLLNNSKYDKYNNNQLSASSWSANEYSVLQKSGQNILGNIDDIYKNMYTKKLNLE